MCRAFPGCSHTDRSWHCSSWAGSPAFGCLPCGPPSWQPLPCKRGQNQLLAVAQGLNQWSKLAGGRAFTPALLVTSSRPSTWYFLVPYHYTLLSYTYVASAQQLPCWSQFPQLVLLSTGPLSTGYCSQRFFHQPDGTSNLPTWRICRYS